MSKKTAVLGNYLLQLWQKEKNLIGGKLRITNLAPIVRYLGTSHSELKIYLLYLGGYTYPMVTNDEDGGITLSQEQLFRIEFKYSRETAGKYKKEIGTTLLAFLRDAPVQYVDITPNIALLDGMKGKGLGNVLVSDNYIKLALDISDLAYKILSYTASNRPSQRIGEDKLIEKLNLQEQQKKRGTPWMRQQISKGFTELQEKRHIKKWNFDEAEQIYSFTYTNEIVKHQDFTPKGDPPKKPTKTPHKSRSQN
jgi:hypothetical protein